jgi:predicted acetyltransferase
MSSDSGLRCICPEEAQWLHVHRAVADGFGEVVMGDDLGARDHLRPPKRRLALIDERSTDQPVVGGAFAYAFDMSLPGGACVPVAGLGGVSISPVAQGRGGLPQLIGNHLQQSIDAGDAASVLMASESGLYQRYGYGMATEMAEWHLHTREYQLLRPVSDDISIRLIHERSQAAELLQRVYESAVNARQGGIHRSTDWWPLVLNDDEHSWFGNGPEFVAVAFAGDIPCGYALYKLRGGPDTASGHGRVNQQVVVSELIAPDTEAELALFNYLSKLAMVRELVWAVAPVDPPVRHFMRDPRQLWQRVRTDMMWLRPLDLPVLFTSIEYEEDGEVVIDYCDPQFESLCQVWRLTVTGGSAIIEKCDRAVLETELHVALDSAVLGNVILGTTRVIELARVGKVLGSEAAVRQFDRLFRFDQTPFNANKF